jgi:hypothetical protein
MSRGPEYGRVHLNSVCFNPGAKKDWLAVTRQDDGVFKPEYRKSRMLLNFAVATNETIASATSRVDVISDCLQNHTCALNPNTDAL